MTFILIFCGLFSGLLAGVMGLGGGVVLVPMIKALGYSPVQAVATSSLAIVITSISASWQNYRMGNLDLQRVIWLGLPSLFTAQLGVIVASLFPPYLLLVSFSIFLVINIFLAQLKKQIIAQNSNKESPKISPLIARLLTGGVAGFLAGLFGIGGGVVIVPLQIVLLGESIKSAIQISLGVIVITSISACLGHALQGNILLYEGIILGFGGLIGAQFSTRFLPKISDKVVSFSFNLLLGILSIYVMYQAYTTYINQ